MPMFLNSAELDEITALTNTGFVDGVTTSPLLIAKSRHTINNRNAKISAIVDEPISPKVAVNEYETMLAEGRKLAAVAPNVAVKAMTGFILAFAGRLDDIGRDGKGLIKKLCTLYPNYDYLAEILIAFVRSTQIVNDAARAGADVVTLPPKILAALCDNALAHSRLDAFSQD